MKKIFVFIATLALVFMSCDSGDIIGGCYHGTFQNKSNGKLETGSLSFTYNRVIVGGDTLLYFMMNDVLPMSETGKCQFSGDVPPTLLSDVLKTMPAIDSIQVCDSTESVSKIHIISEFKGSSVRTNLDFTTSGEKTVSVDFVGYLE